ncbi:elongation factor Tu domain-containing protein [Loa loa]|uniref:Elongation factor Tu domain-containing protein n=1 Tax=Loa loa TaxID=7209 RepID=A0A1I7VZ87_LOALO|nr:elongation factor Tu domain-containing protein [Loa loa]EFO23627.1 elongation factor Tu domain-containing protein [Loa loa]
MADERSRRGLNPNAQSFIPNPAARPFVPGQPYVFTSQPPPMYHHPPPSIAQGAYPVYQQYGQMGPTNVAQHMVPPSVATPMYHQPIATTAAPLVEIPSSAPSVHRLPPSQQQAPVDAWDDEIDEREEVIGTKEGLVTEEVINNDSSPAEKEQEPMKPTDLETVKPGNIGSKANNIPVTRETDDEDIALPVKLKQAYIDDSSRKEHVNMVFIGHVDAGKSTIGGHLMYLTGMVDKRTLEKYEREAKDKGRESWDHVINVVHAPKLNSVCGGSPNSISKNIPSFCHFRYLSWALDTNDEEREKGKTVECGRAFFETEKKHFTILDAPGHKSFVPNMISGATQADLAVLVISARKGEFETGFDRGGQTREHAMLVKTTGVKYLVVLVNKMDDPTVNWNEERYKEIQNKLTPYLRKCGFNPKTDIIYIPVSGLTGAFLKERPSSEFGSWYTGPCFIEYIDTMLPSISRDYEGPVRVIIADKYSDMGTIILGKMESGVVVKGQTLTVMPNRTSIQVIQLWSDDVEVDKVVSGDNVKLKLKGIEDNDILPGFVLCSPDALCHVGRVFDAEVVILDHKSIIASGYSCVLHIQSATEEVIVKAVICTIDKKTGSKVRARFVKQDEKCIMRLESSESFCLEAFKNFPQMGRFTLRDEGKTIAIGKVLKVVE